MKNLPKCRRTEVFHHGWESVSRRAGWLARPWFLVAVALLALNDHVFKTAWPGWVTGKLSDVSGLVVVATLGAVLLGARGGTVVAGVAFVLLKLVPGVAEATSPLLGGGVVLRDASDLLALAALPPLWFVLRRERSDRARRTRRGWALVGLAAGVLATTATSSPLDRSVDEVDYADGTFYARVTVQYGMGDRWLASHDGGRTWGRILIPPRLSSAPEGGSETWSDCANDGICYRARMAYPAGYPREADSQHLVERSTSGSVWVTEADIDTAPAFIGLAVNPSDSSQAVVVSWAYGFYREPSGTWREVDLVELASDPEWVRSAVVWLGSPTATLLLGLVLSVLGWVLMPTLSLKWMAQVCTLFVGGLTYLIGRWLLVLVIGMPVVWVHLLWAVLTVGGIVMTRAISVGRRATLAPPRGGLAGGGFDPPSGAR